MSLWYLHEYVCTSVIYAPTYLFEDPHHRGKADLPTYSKSQSGTNRPLSGKCSEPCPKGRYHPANGKGTKAMEAKRLVDEEKMKKKAEAGGRGTQSEVEGGSGSEKGPKAPKVKAKAKEKP